MMSQQQRTHCIIHESAMYMESNDHNSLDGEWDGRYRYVGGKEVTFVAATGFAATMWWH